MPPGPRTGLVALLSAVSVVASIALAPGAAAQDVPAAQDNPPGCTTATSEREDGCGAQGRNHTDGPAHRPPITACAGQRSAAGSRVVRILPTGPLRPDGALAFTSGACVYLPPGYDSSGLRYSVLYLLHGGGGDQAGWVTFGDVQRILDDAYAADPDHALVVVMPDGRSGQFYDYLDQRFLIEAYLLKHLVPAVDQRFRTIADRTGRAIAGLSNGGYGALHMAAKAPDLFSVAGSMSGNLGARTMDGLGPAGETYYMGNVPHRLAANLDEVDLIIDWGATCSSDLLVDACSTWAFEQAFRLDNQEFRTSLDTVGYTGTVDYRETEGGHAWRWWSRWLRDRDLPFFFDRLHAPTAERVPPSPIPASFRYRSIAPRFSVWGYDVEVQRDTLGFTDLTDVTAGGFTAHGAGMVTVRTGARYRAGESFQVVVDGGVPRQVEADDHGRLVVEVELSSDGSDQAHEVAIGPSGGAPALVPDAVTAASGPIARPRPPRADSLSSPLAAAPGSAPAPAASTGVAPEAGPSPGPSLLVEPVYRVSVPLTLFMLALVGTGLGLWWRRRRPTAGGAG